MYVLVDPSACDDPAAVAVAAIAGGAGIIQLRAKRLDAADYLRLASAVQGAVRQAGGLFVVNDHVAVAAAIEADACHIGQDDCAFAAARGQLPPTCALGVSCHSLAQLLEAQANGADYVGLGPMFSTATKPHEPVRGPQLLDDVRSHIRIPSYAIGGLSAERIHALGARLPHGVAVSSAVTMAADPTSAARDLCAALPQRQPQPERGDLPQPDGQAK